MFMFDKLNHFVLYSGTKLGDEGDFRHLNDLFFILFILVKNNIVREKIYLYIDLDILEYLNTKTNNKIFQDNLTFKEYIKKYSIFEDIAEFRKFHRNSNENLIFFSSGHGNIEGLHNGKDGSYITPCFFESIASKTNTTFLFLTQCFAGAFHHLDTRKNISIIGASEYQNSVSLPIKKYNLVQNSNEIAEKFSFYDNIAINPFIYIFFIKILTLNSMNRTNKNILNIYKYIVSASLELVKQDVKFILNIKEIDKENIEITLPYKIIQQPYLLNKIKASEIFLEDNSARN